MIQHFKALKNTSRLNLVFIWLCLMIPSAGLSGEFRSDRDRRIVRDILKIFGKECIQKVATDSETLKRLEGEGRRAKLERNRDVQRCFEANLSQTSGVHFLFEKLCSEIAKNPSNINDDIAAKQLVGLNRYQSGIRPFHSVLNDCLYGISDKSGLTYVVPLAGLAVDSSEIRQQLEYIRIKEPYTATGVPFR